MARGPLKVNDLSPTLTTDELKSLDPALVDLIRAVHADRDQWNAVHEREVAERVVKLSKIRSLRLSEEDQWARSGPATSHGQVVEGSIGFRLRCAIEEGRLPMWFIRRLALAAITRGEDGHDQEGGHVDPDPDTPPSE